MKGEKALYAHASRILHHETNPARRRITQKHGDRYVGITRLLFRFSPRMHSVFALPYKRVPHPAMAMPVFRLTQ
ncbi:hypothetical protein ACNKHV_19050 [Shigella flexneri]